MTYSRLQNNTARPQQQHWTSPATPSLLDQGRVQKCFRRAPRWVGGVATQSAWCTLTIAPTSTVILVASVEILCFPYVLNAFERDLR